MISLLKRPPMLGLDIQSDSIHLMSVKRHRGHYQSVIQEVITLPEPSSQDGKLILSNALQQALITLVEISQIAKQKVIIALPYSNVMVRRITLPVQISEVERETEIRENLSHYFPGMMDEIGFDFTIVNKSQNGFDDVMVVAAKKSEINLYLNLCETANLRVKRIDVDVFAWQRAIHNMWLQKIVYSCWAILTLDKHHIKLIVYHEHEIISKSWVMQEIYECLKQFFEAYPDRMPETLFAMCEVDQHLSALIQQQWRFKIISAAELSIKLDPQWCLSCGLAMAGSR